MLESSSKAMHLYFKNYSGSTVVQYSTHKPKSKGSNVASEIIEGIGTIMKLLSLYV
jgi:hypothetical protein